MTQQRTPESPKDKAEGSERAPMERFRDLARGLLNVTPEQVREEQARYEESEDRKRRPPLTLNRS